jgi:hypothetical protein
MLSTLLRNPAIEFLLVNRYLDLDPEFYEAVSGHYTNTLAINTRLAKWPRSDQRIEESFIENKESFTAAIAKVMEFLQ